MPHLSPMNWIAMITLLWTLTTLMYIYQWWTTTLTFKAKISHKKSSNMNQWTW